MLARHVILATLLACLAHKPLGLAHEPADIGTRLPAGAVLRLSNVPFQHQELVSAVAFAPDGKTIASADGGGSVYLWETASGKLLHKLAGHEFYVPAVALAPDGKTLASASVDESVRVWDLKTGREIHRFKDYQTTATAVVFSADSRRLISAAADGALRFYEARSGRLLHKLIVPGGSIRTLALSKDEQKLASAGKDGTIRLWDIATARLIRPLGKHKGQVESIAFDPSGKRLASAGADHTLRLWNVATGHEIRNTQASCVALAFDPAGKFVACATGPKEPFLWDVHTAGMRPLFPGYRETFSCIAVAPDGSMAAVGSDSHVIRLWDLRVHKEITPFSAHQKAIASISYAADGRSLATASLDGTVRLWDAASGKASRCLSGFGGKVTCAAFSHDADALAISSAGAGHGLYVWSPASGRMVQRLENPWTKLAAATLSADGRLLAVENGTHRQVGIWHVATGKRETILLDLNYGGTAVPGGVLALSTDGRMLAVGGKGADILVWDRQTGNKRTMKHPVKPSGMSEVTLSASEQLAFSVDGRLLAVAGSDFKISLWETAGGAGLRTLAGHGQRVRALAFSPSGRVLASAGAGRTIILWDIVTGEELRRLKGHSHDVLTLAFAPDGSRLASAGADFTAFLWDVSDVERDRPPPFQVTPENVSRLWTILTQPGATQAENVIWSLAAAPAPTLPLLQKQFRPIPRTAPDRIAELIADLDHKRYARRTAAFRELTALGDVAEGALRTRLIKADSFEQYKRIRRLLDMIDARHVNEGRLAGRVTRTLELMKTPAARQMLQALAGGAPGALRTRAAQAALRRCRSEPGN